MAKLGDIIEQIRGVSYKPADLHDNLNNNSVILLRANNIQNGKIVIDDVVYVSKNKVSESQYLRQGDILVCTSSGSKELVGKAAFVDKDLPMVFGAFCKVVRPKIECCEYMGHFFQSPYYRNHISAASAGANINNLRNEHIADLHIPLPSFDEQRKIAAVLDKVSHLISKRRQQLNKLDEMVKARFVEMFGEPIYNSKGLPTEQGINFFKLSNGKFLPESKRFTSGIPAYGGNGVSWYTDDPMIKNNTLVVGRVGFQSGNVRFVAGPLWITDNAMYVSDYDTQKYDLLFLCALMEHINFTRFQDAGDLKKITQKPFMNMEYIRPSLHEQHKYVFFVKQTEKMKTTVSHSLEKLETLKKALMQEYFG